MLILAVIVLIAIIAGAAYYIFHQQQQMDEMTQSFDLEKEMMADDLNELSLQYEGYKFSVSNDSLVALLTTEQAKVQRLMEELRTVKSTNAKEIARLKKELATLRKIMRNYVIQIDSLNRANEQLKVEKERSGQEIPPGFNNGCQPETGKREADRTGHTGQQARCHKYFSDSGQLARQTGQTDQEDGTVCHQLQDREECNGSCR